MKVPPACLGLLLAGFVAPAWAAVPVLAPVQAEALREVWRRGITEGQVPGGVMLVARRGEVVFREAFGVADLARGDPFPVDAPCRIASVTKPFTAALLGLLVAEGRLGWDDPLDLHLPAFRGVRVAGGGPAARVPRVRELLAHTAGFAGQSARGEERWRIRTGGTLADAVDDLARAGLAAEPGTRYAYSGLGYLVAGRVAEVVAGEEFAALLARRLLAPLGIRDVAFPAGLAPERAARLPTFYDRSSGALVPDTGGPAFAFPNPGGGLVATADEVAALLRLHLDDGRAGGSVLLPAAVLAELQTVQPGTARDGYALGFNVVRAGPDGRGVRLRHNGASGTLALLDRQRQMLVVVLTQVPAKQRPAFTRSLDAVIDQLLEAP